MHWAGISESQQAMICSAGEAFSRHTRESAARCERQRQQCSPSARSSKWGAGKRQGSHARQGDAQHKMQPARQQPATVPCRNVGIFESQQQATSRSAGDACSCNTGEQAAGHGQQRWRCIQLPYLGVSSRQWAIVVAKHSAGVRGSQQQAMSCSASDAFRWCDHPGRVLASARAPAPGKGTHSTRRSQPENSLPQRHAG
ncbi:unnamed protein product [Ostreobium quekettii]|uniref:Uncharacterized protein n=1 Tax=Ostreobium quekettii TaxID=121088 RepID=A0A8S1IZD3_9CHLO|nr:unnamed protein product [Ostreobium quekettii]